MRPSRCLLVLLACSGALFGARAESGRPHPMEDRFFTVILAPEERAAYEMLADDAKRAFQRRHWGRLDPTPASEENEREAEHQLRVVEAIDRYVDRAGRFTWDDRTRAWIRFGKPARIDTVEGGAEDEESPAPPRELWFYDDEVLVFEGRALGGSYVFGMSPGGETPGGDLERRLRAGEELWRNVTERNEHEPATSEIPFDLNVSLFGRPDSLACVFSSIEVPFDRLGRALDVDRGERSVRLEVGSTLRDSTYAIVLRGRRTSVSVPEPGAGAKAGLVLVDTLTAKPGRYRMLLEVEDLAAGKSGFAEISLAVPSFAGDTLRFGGPILAERITTDFRASGVARRGEYRIDPKPDATFRRGAPVHVYFELYGLRPDRDGRFYSEIAYSLVAPGGEAYEGRFRGTEKGRLRRGEIERCRTVSRAPTSVHSIEIETSGLPPNEYDLVVEVVDRSTGGSIRTEKRFILYE